MSGSVFSQLKVAELRAACEQRQITSTGTKHELVTRLEAHQAENPETQAQAEGVKVEATINESNGNDDKTEVKKESVSSWDSSRVQSWLVGLSDKFSRYQAGWESEGVDGDMLTQLCGESDDEANRILQNDLAVASKLHRGKIIKALHELIPAKKSATAKKERRESSSSKRKLPGSSIKKDDVKKTGSNGGEKKSDDKKDRKRDDDDSVRRDPPRKKRRGRDRDAEEDMFRDPNAPPPKEFDNKKVYVTCVPLSWTEQRLRKFLSSVGTITDINFLKQSPKRGRRAYSFAFIGFSSESQARSAVDLLDEHVEMDERDNQKCVFKAHISVPKINMLHSRHLYIPNIPAENLSDERSLREIFSKFGPLTRLRFQRRGARNSADVHFERHEDAREAKLAYDGKRHEESGRQWTVMLAKVTDEPSDRDEPLEDQFGQRIEPGTRDDDQEGVIYITGLPPVFTETHLKNIFERFGEVTTVTVAGGNKRVPGNIGFVHFDRLSSAARAVRMFNDTIPEGYLHPLRVMWRAKDKGRGAPRNGGGRGGPRGGRRSRSRSPRPRGGQAQAGFRDREYRGGGRGAQPRDDRRRDDRKMPQTDMRDDFGGRGVGGGSGGGDTYARRGDRYNDRRPRDPYAAADPYAAPARNDDPYGDSSYRAPAPVLDPYSHIVPSSQPARTYSAQQQPAYDPYLTGGPGPMTMPARQLPSRQAPATLPPQQQQGGGYQHAQSQNRDPYSAPVPSYNQRPQGRY